MNLRGEDVVSAVALVLESPVVEAISETGDEVPGEPAASPGLDDDGATLDGLGASVETPPTDD